MSMERNEDLWYSDRISDSEKHDHRIERWIVRKESQHQVLSIAESVTYGKCLIIDDDLQSCEKDEFIYHEALVHPTMIMHGNPKKVLILGGGEGATLREVLKYHSVETVVMVDIDGEVIQFCRNNIPSFSAGAFEDPRTRIVIGDARDYIKKTQDIFDVIISDLCSPIAGGPAYMLYTSEFYTNLRTKLSSGGMFSAQIDSCGFMDMEVSTVIQKTICTVFPAAKLYACHVPSFDSLWGFSIASVDPKAFDISDAELNNRIRNLLPNDLKFYDIETHKRLFALPKYLRDKISNQHIIITEDNPVFIYK